MTKLKNHDSIFKNPEPASLIWNQLKLAGIAIWADSSSDKEIISTLRLAHWNSPVAEAMIQPWFGIEEWKKPALQPPFLSPLPKKQWSDFVTKGHQNTVRLAWDLQKTIQNWAFVPFYVEGLGKIEAITY